MSKIETLAILNQIQALVSDKLQVVSYKWLSRNFSVTSNAAKRLLEQLIEKHGSELEVVYALSGWLKSDLPTYHIRLVSSSNLSEARQEFNGNCSVEVYSVQTCIPKDPAVLWNTEFVQAEELFKQPPTVDNCLRDNRFCGILNAYVKRNADGTPTSVLVPRLESKGVPGQSKHNATHQTKSVPQQSKLKQSSPGDGRQPSDPLTDVSSEKNGFGVHVQASKPPADKEKAPPLPPNKKKDQNDNSSSGTGSSLANLWGRASVKSKPSDPPAESDKFVENDAVSAEAHICAREAFEGENSDDDVQDVNFKRASMAEGGRKRKVVFDFSDEEDVYEDTVNLASPDFPKGKASLKSKKNLKTASPEKCNLDFDKQVENKLRVKEEKASDLKSDQLLMKDPSTVSEAKKAEPCASEKGHISANNVKNVDKVINDAPTSPKRRKVLKTRIDERGREVTEVVWEGEDANVKKDNGDTAKKADNNAVASNTNRPPIAKKSTATGSSVAPSGTVGKTGNKKAGPKDPKQGNILSFFKKVG